MMFELEDLTLQMSVVHRLRPKDPLELPSLITVDFQKGSSVMKYLTELTTSNT
jgi:hypothetical protein